MAAKGKLSEGEIAKMKAQTESRNAAHAAVFFGEKTCYFHRNRALAWWLAKL